MWATLAGSPSAGRTWLGHHTGVAGRLRQQSSANQKAAHSAAGSASLRKALHLSEVN